MLLSHALQHNVRFLRLVECDHVHLHSILELDHLREEGFAYFTLKLGEVIRHCDSVELSFDLAVNPILEAARVNQFTGPLAFAWTYQRICCCSLIAKADFA